MPTIKERDIRLSPLGFHYYAEIDNSDPVELQDAVENRMNQLTTEPFNPRTHAGDYLPPKEHVAGDTVVGTLTYKLDNGRLLAYDVELSGDVAAWYQP